MLLAFILLPLLPLAAGPGNGIEEILERNRDGLALIQSIDARIHAEYSPDAGVTWAPAYDVEWRSAPGRRRTTIHHRVRVDNDTLAMLPAERFVDDYFGPDLSQTMTGWNPKLPPKLPLRPDDGYANVKGEINTVSPLRNGGMIDAWWGYRVEGWQTPEEAVRRVAAKKLLPVSIIDGDEIHAIELGGASEDKRTLYFSGKHNFLIKMMRSTGRVAGVKGARGARIEIEHEITSFREAKPGVWVPDTMLATTRLLGKDDKTLMVRARTESVRVNEPIAEADIKFDFPPGLMVYDASSGGPKAILQVWGKDGPSRTFASDAEARTWERSKIDGGTGSGQISFVWINATLIVIVIALMIARRRMARA